MIDPKEAPKFSDSFDRASFFTFQMSSVNTKLDEISAKLDKFTDSLNAHDRRMTVLERDRLLYLALAVLAMLFSILALGAVIYKQ